MKESFFASGSIWLKGMLHCHSTVSDGRLSPEELAKAYQDKGYDFLSITDHNVFLPHDDLSASLILISGVEHDIEYSNDKCIHLIGTGAHDKYSTSYECKRYSKEEIIDNELIAMMKSDGQFVTLAHPVWSRMKVDEILALKGIDAVEVYNNGTEHLCHGGNGETIWELMLQSGMKVFATACDDVHLPEDMFGGWIWVKAEKKTKEAIITALSKGRFYSSSGPQIKDFGIESDMAYIICTDCESIHFVSWPPRGQSFFAGKAALRAAEHRMCGREKYIRAVCIDQSGHAAWSNPIFFD